MQELVRQLVDKKFKEASAEIEPDPAQSDRIARIGPKESVEAVEHINRLSASGLHLQSSTAPLGRTHH